MCVCLCALDHFLALICPCGTWIESSGMGAVHFSAPYGHECMSYCIKQFYLQTHTFAHTFTSFHSPLIVVCFCCMLDLHSQVMVVQNARYVILYYSTCVLYKTWTCSDRNGLMRSRLLIYGPSFVSSFDHFFNVV